MRYVRTSEGSNKIRIDGLSKRTYIYIYISNRREVKYNTTIQTKPRGRVQIPLLVAGPDGTAINV
jgi:hypothetical protein